MTTTWNRERINALLERNDRSVERALIALFHRQTTDEQKWEQTKHHNGIGFSGYDAEIFTSFAKQVLNGRQLSPKQLAVCRKRDRQGNMRIGCYWRQLLQEIEHRQAAEMPQAA